MTENIEMIEKSSHVRIDTIESLLIHLNKYAAAYRKSYKLCDRVDASLKITSGLLGCTAILALIPTIPILITLAGAIPAGITIVSTKAKFADKSALYKIQHRRIKELISYVHKMSVEVVDEKEVIKDVFARILINEKETDYIMPLEKYMKKFKLNGYNV